VQLMSRKQRAAKLLTGDIGLTGLDALTEGEGGFEEALMDAIGRDETLLDPSQIFKATGAVGEIDVEDAAYWNVDDVGISEVEQIVASPDPLIVAEVEPETLIMWAEPPQDTRIVPSTAAGYLDTVTLIMDGAKWRKLRAELLDRVADETETELCDWLRENRIVFPGCEAEVSTRLRELVSGKAVIAAAIPAEQPEPRVRPVTPKHKPGGKIVPFPKPESVYDDAPARQLALF